MTPAPDVSVIMPAWKASAFARAAIDSCLASTGVNVEVVVVDDASPDDTFAILQSIAASDARVKVARLPSNGGPSAARNLALDMAAGRYIAVIDSDDTILPERLANLVALADQTGADIVVDNMFEIDEHGQPIGDGVFLKSPSFANPREIDLETWVRFNQPMVAGDCIGYLKPLIRRETMARLGARYDVGLRNSEDYYLVAHMLAAGAHMRYTPVPGYRYVRYASSTSHRLKPSQTAAWLEAETGFRARHAATLSDTQAKALDRRMRLLTNVNHFVQSIDAIQHRRLPGLFSLMASDLRAAGYTLSTLARIALGKASGRKLV